ncbi:sialate O-acetylesterase [Bacteroides caecigallinarum]|uniref:sialate O-acetylesterase n=1 Tax=Bacteroides caecigallinarum TaxID=1411144 RepID=UPI00195C34B5|nr:sialate O-acetylesterase [Bacteroides caecigallinarum]
MKRLIYFFFAVAMMLPVAGCNDDPDFIKNAPPSSGETDGTDDDSDAGDDGTVEGVDPNFQIYLCFGQSNMEGFASLDGTYNGIEDKDKTVDERFQVMNVVSGSWNGVQREVGHWYTAVPPLCRSNTGLCPADYFGRTMVEELSKTNPDIKVGVIVVAIGGAGIKAFHKTKYNEYYTGTDDWQRSLMDIYDRYPYGTLVDMARIAQKQGVIKGILMHQGESDAYQDYWEDTVSEIYNDLISDLGLKVEEVPLLVGEMCREKNGVNLNNPDGPIQNLKNYISNCYVISSENCPGYEDPTDDWHFSSEGYRELGRHYAQTMLDILANQEPEDPNASVPASNNHFDLAKLDADLESDPNPSETSWNVDTGELTTKANGIGGWKFETPIDLTVSNYLIVEFSEKPAVSGTRLAIYSDSYSVFDYSYTNGTIEGNMIVIDIKNGTFETSKYGVSEKKTLDLKNIKMLGIQTGGGGSVKIKRVYLDDKKPEIPDEPEQGTSASVSNDFFDFSTLNSDLEGKGRGSWDNNTGKLVTSEWGLGGWVFDTPLDFTASKYLVVEFKEAPTIYCQIAFYSDGRDVYGKSYCVGASKRVVIDTHGTYTTKDGATPPNEGTLDMTSIKMLGIQTNGNETGVLIDKIYVTDINPDGN